MEHKHTLSVIVENKPGVLQRVAGLFTRRGFNIESLAVGTTEDPKLSRMTIVVEGDDQIVEQVTKQLYKQIDVIKVFDLPKETSIERELLLIKVSCNKKNQPEILQLAEVFKCPIVDMSGTSLILEAVGDNAKIKNIEETLSKFGIKEIVRTGRIGMLRDSEKTA